MELRQLAAKEQLVKTVVRSGNGGAVWVPKSWLGQEVVIILPEKPRLGLKERIVHLLEPYLKDVISVGIYGSYARNEQEKDSDIDVLAVTSEKRMKIKEGNVEITSLPIDKLKSAIQKYPTMYHQMVREAVPLINALVLEDLKSIKVKKENFMPYLRETREHGKSNREFLELDKLDGPYLASYSVMYSAMLRLRGLFIMKCILEKGRFSNRNFKSWLKAKGVRLHEYESCYHAYRLMRDGRDAKSLKISVETAEKLLAILHNELDYLEAQVNGQ